MRMRFLILFSIIGYSNRLPAQKSAELFVEQKLSILISAAEKDLESLKAICKAEEGLLRTNHYEEVYTYTYQSAEQEYLIAVAFHFNKLFCKKIKIEITPTDNSDLVLGKVVTKALKKKFNIQKNTVADNKSQTKKFFLSNSKFSGILALHDDTKNIDLVLSIKTD